MKALLLIVLCALTFSPHTAQSTVLIYWNGVAELHSAAQLAHPFDESGNDSHTTEITSINFAGSSSSSFFTSTDTATSSISFTSTLAGFSFTSGATATISCTAGSGNGAATSISATLRIESDSDFTLFFEQSGDYSIGGLPHGSGSMDFPAGSYSFFPSMSQGVGDPSTDFNQVFEGYCNFTVVPVPEPSVVALLGVAGILACGIRRLRKP